MKKQLFVLAVLLLPLGVWADFITLSTKEAQIKIANGVAVIDVRRQDEYNRYGVIPGSHRLTFFDGAGNYNVEKWLKDLAKIVKTKDTPFILVCAHANRTKIIGNFLNSKTDYKTIFELGGGINYGWIDKGLPTTKTSTGK